MKPFFSDAEKPEETIIGQLNLRQIVEEEKEKPSHAIGFKKIKEENNVESKNRIEFERICLSGQPIRRPITLITFPSNHSIDSPFKPVISISQEQEKKK